MQIDNIKAGNFLREKRNYLEYWRKFNIIKIITKYSLFTGERCNRIKCCREGNNSKITLAEYSISQENIMIRFKKAEINYIFKWILENLREENIVILEEG